nr:MAG TPA: hypothetical protein [Caudoviricetes sp.]
MYFIHILGEDLRTYIHQYDEMIVLIDLLLDIYLELPLGRDYPYQAYRS